MKTTIAFLLPLLFVSCGIHSLTKKGVYVELEPEKYLNYVNDSTVNIIDVRTNAEFEKTHIYGALNVNYFAGHFEQDLAKLQLDPLKTTLIYCETQHRSLLVAKKLYRAGFTRIIDLDKGMMHYRKLGLPHFSSETE